jgi:hypothetical protein
MESECARVFCLTREQRALWKRSERPRFASTGGTSELAIRSWNRLRSFVNLRGAPLAKRRALRLLLILEKALTGLELNLTDAASELFCENRTFFDAGTIVGGFAKQFEDHRQDSI